MMKRTLIGFLVLLPAVLFGQYNRPGSTDAQFLKIGVSARGTGMADAYMAAVNGADAAYYNSAALPWVPGRDVVFTHTSWFAGINHEFAAATHAIDVHPRHRQLDPTLHLAMPDPHRAIGGRAQHRAAAARGDARGRHDQRHARADRARFRPKAVVVEDRVGQHAAHVAAEHVEEAVDLGLGDAHVTPKFCLINEVADTQTSCPHETTKVGKVLNRTQSL